MPQPDRPASDAAFVPEAACRCVSGHHTCGLPNPEEELILALARIEAAEHDLAMERSLSKSALAANDEIWKQNRKLQESVDLFVARAQGAEAENGRLRAALEKIAASPRPDGTYNLSREACEEIAREALRRGDT